MMPCILVKIYPNCGRTAYIFYPEAEWVSTPEILKNSYQATRCHAIRWLPYTQQSASSSYTDRDNPAGLPPCLWTTSVLFCQGYCKLWTRAKGGSNEGHWDGITYTSTCRRRVYVGVTGGWLAIRMRATLFLTHKHFVWFLSHTLQVMGWCFRDAAPLRCAPCPPCSDLTTTRVVPIIYLGRYCKVNLCKKKFLYKAAWVSFYFILHI
jgi:hypothetical protein